MHRFGPSDHVPLRIYYEYTTGGKTPSQLSSSNLAVAATVMKRSELESLSNAVLRGAETNWHLSSPPSQSAVESAALLGVSWSSMPPMYWPPGP